MKINSNGIKILFGLFTFYGIYELRKFYIKLKTQILFEQIWEQIRIIQETDPVRFRRMVNNVISPQSFID